MASKCKKCGEKLYPSDTFCGFCGEPVDNVDLGLGEISRVPRPLVGVDALSKKEREVIEEAKIKYRETKQLESEEKKKEDDMPLGKRVEDLKNRINAREMEKKKAVILAERKAAEEAARAEAERKAAEEAARAEAERKAAEEAARAEAERKAAEEAARAEAERKAAEEAARAEAERKAAEEAARAEAERKAAEEAARAENLERLKAEQQAAEERAAKLEEKARELQEQAEKLNSAKRVTESDKKTENDSFEYIEEFEQEDYQMDVREESGEDELVYCEMKYEPDEEIWGKNAGRTLRQKDETESSKKKILIFSAGIIVLIIIIAFLLRNELSRVPGNDSGRTDGSATEQSASENKGDTYAPSDSADAWDGSIALKFTEGQGTAESPYIISTGSELAYMAEEVNRGVNFSGVYFKLKNDISLGGLDWTPAGYYSMQEDGKDTVYAFSGVFDGDGHTISDFNIGEAFISSMTEKYSNNMVCGLFGATYSAEISNLTVKNGTIGISNESGEIYAGVLAGCTYETVIKNCNADGKINVNGSHRVCAGIFAGAVNGGSLETVTTDGELVSATSGDTNDGGAVAGYVKSAKLKDFNSKGTVSISGSGNVYAGGICGYAAETDVESASSENAVSANADAADGVAMAGGIFGWHQGGMASTLDSRAQVNVSGIYYVYAGGVYGYAESVTAEKLTGDCIVVSKAGGDASFVISGGAAGLLTDTTVSDVTVKVTLETEGANINYSGGIAGQVKAGSLTAGEVTTEISAKSTGSVSGMVMCGGLVGSISEAEVSETKCEGSIKTDSQIDGHAGGAFGYINGGTYKNIESTATIENTAKIGVSSGGFAGYAVTNPATENCTGTGTRTNNGENIYDDDFIAIVNQ